MKTKKWDKPYMMSIYSTKHYIILFQTDFRCFFVSRIVQNFKDSEMMKNTKSVVDCQLNSVFLLHNVPEILLVANVWLSKFHSYRSIPPLFQRILFSYSNSVCLLFKLLPNKSLNKVSVQRHF